jgi:hypothetical protein
LAVGEIAAQDGNALCAKSFGEGNQKGRVGV